MPTPSRLVGSLAASVPFVGPETIERQMGRRFRLRLGANESPYGPSALAVAAMERAARKAQDYGDPEGWELRSALSQKHGIPREAIRLASGIDELLALFCRAFGDPGSSAITTLGSYPTFEYGATGAGLVLQRVSYRDRRLDLESLAAAARDSAARIVYVANPDNPSGTYRTAADLKAFRSELPSDALLMLDEAYADYAPAAALPEIDTEDAGVVRLRTFSKAHGLAGLRIGYVMGHPDTVGVLDRIRMHFGVSSVAQAGALASLQDPGHVEKVVEATRRTGEHLDAMARKLGLSPHPSATNFRLLEVGSAARAESLLTALRDEGVFVRKPAAPPLDGCIRVTIPKEEDLHLLERALASCLGRNLSP